MVKVFLMVLHDLCVLRSYNTNGKLWGKAYSPVLCSFFVFPRLSVSLGRSLAPSLHSISRVPASAILKNSLNSLSVTTYRNSDGGWSRGRGMGQPGEGG